MRQFIKEAHGLAPCASCHSIHSNMKKLLLSAAAIGLICFLPVQAQTLLEEDFETSTTADTPSPIAKGAGWSVINSYNGSEFKYNWHNAYREQDEKYGGLIYGEHCAQVDGSLFGDGEGIGPREEMLLTPELNLDDTYQLQFSFVVGPTNAQEDSRYDLQVRVVENGEDPTTAETIFTLHDDRVLREAGVDPYPVNDWNIRTARLDLSDFKGKKVKLAFVYKMYKKQGNVARIDEVSVKKFTPATTPQALLSKESFDFGTLLIGEKKWSDVFTLYNRGTDGLKITSVDMPDCIQLTFDPKDVDLLRNEKVEFNIAYTASMTSPANGKVVFHTNGGDVEIAVKASKQLLPEGATLEGFEKYFPPAGWKSTGWARTQSSIEGDYSADCDGGYSKCYLTSPALDLTDGGEVTFTFANIYNGEESPEYDIELQLSLDGGTNWTKKWSTSGATLNEIQTVKVKLCDVGSDESYIRWYYPEVESDDYGAFEHSRFLLDRVLLPKLTGADGVPGKVKQTSPALNSENIYPKDVTLTWEPAQFADGYRLYVGTNSEADDLIKGEDLGDACSYTIPITLKYATTYRWRVVAYNDKGDSPTASAWRFTTQPDATVAAYPYTQNFENVQGSGVPVGWTTGSTSAYPNRGWSPNNMYPYKTVDASYPAMSCSWLNPDEYSWLETPEVKLPDDKVMALTMLWGDGHPSDLKVDPSGLREKQNAEPDNGVDRLSLQVLEGGEWKTLTTLSEKPDGEDIHWWISEKVDLADYRGKTVKLRWRYDAFSTKSDGAAIAHVVIDENKEYTAGLNRSSWDAGKVNWNKAIESGEIFTLFNQGTKDLEVESVEFGKSNFTTSLRKGDKIPADGAMKFSVRFDALTTAAPVEDKLTVTLTGGAAFELALKGEALPENTLYYSFEPNVEDYDWTKDFSMIDVDKGVNFNFTSSWVNYSAGGQKGAFSAENDSNETGLYGMMKPVSGLWALVAACPQQGHADNWLVSQKLAIKQGAKFSFYARNLDSKGTVLPDPLHCIEILVSEKSNTETSDFAVLREQEEIPLAEYDEWNFYEVDLSSYAGKNVHVALRHLTDATTNLAFFDDLRFDGVSTDIIGAGVESIAADTSVEVFDLNGIRVAEGRAGEALKGLDKGVYIVRSISDAGVKTLRVIL